MSLFKWWWERHWFHVWCVVIEVEGMILITLMALS